MTDSPYEAGVGERQAWNYVEKVLGIYPYCGKLTKYRPAKVNKELTKQLIQEVEDGHEKEKIRVSEKAKKDYKERKANWDKIKWNRN